MKRMIRPLPLMIAVMMLLIIAKVAGLVQVAAGFRAGFGTASSGMVTAAYASSAHAPAHGASQQPAAPAHSAAPLAAVPAPVAPPINQEPPVSEAERTVLQELRARRATLDGRVQSIEAREAILAAAERKLNERVEQLTALQSRLEQLEGGRRERDEANWRGLVKTYESMRPKDAAAILNDMESPILIQVLDRMKEAKAAQVLAAMLPDRARAATTQLAQWRTRALTPAPAVGPQG